MCDSDKLTEKNDFQKNKESLGWGMKLVDLGDFYKNYERIAKSMPNGKISSKSTGKMSLREKRRGNADTDK